MKQVFLSIDGATFETEQECTDHEASLFGAWLERAKSPRGGRPPSGVSAKLSDVIEYTDNTDARSTLWSILESYFKYRVANPPAPKPKPEVNDDEADAGDSGEESPEEIADAS
jgi:hypothetical protein